MSHDHDHTSHREVIVTDSGNRGTGYVLAVIIAILGVLLVVWLFLNVGGGEGGDVLPDEVNVDIDDGGGESGGGGGESGGGDTGGG